MGKETKLRSEVNDEYKWDLKVIYKDIDSWENDYEKAKDLILKIKDYEDIFLDSQTNLLNYLKFDEKLERLILKLYYYAHLNYDSDTLDNNYKKLYDRSLNLYDKYSIESSFFIPKVLNFDVNKLNSYINSSDDMKQYKKMFDEILRYKEHTLSKENEKLIHKFTKVLNNSSKTYDSLIYSDIKFNNVLDKDGNSHELSENLYSTYLISDDRILRKNAFFNLLNKYGSYKNLITNLYTGHLESNMVISKLKNYKSMIDASLFNENINISVYNNLIKVINSNMNVMHKFYKMKKDVLKIDQLHIYDTYVPLIKESNKKYTFDEAKKLVLNALSVLGDDYILNLNKAFDEKWIDIYHNKGKYTGAYSSGFYDINPYVLLNYNGTINDVSTLAHELGHSMHTYYSCKNNLYIYSKYEIFVAEVASTVNELLLSDYLLKNSNNKEEKLSVLNHIIDMFKATLYRQTMFAEFEYEIHKKYEEEENLNPDDISNYYLKLVEKYHGDDVIIDECIKYEWMRIPHFYSDFYVYKYATGISAACYIAENIINDKNNIKEKYLEFLKTGGSMYPLEELKIASVDISDEKTIKSAVDMFNKYIDEFITVIKS